MADVILRHPNQLLPSPSIIDIHTVELVFVGYASFDLQPPAFSCRLFSHGTFPAQALMRDYCNSLCLLIGLPARVEGTLQRRRPAEGCGRESAIAVVVNSNNNDKGTGQQVRGRGMGGPSLLSDPLLHWRGKSRQQRRRRKTRFPPRQPPQERSRRFESHVGIADVNVVHDDGAPDRGSCSGTSEQTQRLSGGRGYSLPPDLLLWGSRRSTLCRR